LKGSLVRLTIVVEMELGLLVGEQEDPDDDLLDPTGASIGAVDRYAPVVLAETTVIGLPTLIFLPPTPWPPCASAPKLLAFIS